MHFPNQWSKFSEGCDQLSPDVQHTEGLKRYMRPTPVGKEFRGIFVRKNTVVAVVIRARILTDLS